MTDWIGQVTFVNVGNGDAILVEVPDKGCRDGRFIMLIDGGSNEVSEYADSSTGRIRVVDYMKQKGIEHIDVMVCTHIHEDHTCGLLAVAMQWTPGVLWQPFPKDVMTMMKPLKIKGQTESENKFLAALNDFGQLCKLITMQGGRVIQMTPDKTQHRSMCLADGVYVKVLGPSKQALDREIRWFKALYQESNLRVLPQMDKYMNSASLLLHVTCAGKSFLLTGDTEKTGYGECMEDIRADVFKLGHHGQENSINQEILEAVLPHYAVLCVSSDRRYNSGNPQILQMLAEAGISTYYSDCLQVLPYTDGVRPHQAVLFQIMREGALKVSYESIADREEAGKMQETANIDVKEIEGILHQAGELFQDRAAAEHTRTKGVADYVTEVDYTVQQFIRTQLEKKYPQIQFLSEEKTNDEIDRSGMVWVLDPVDGTTNLIHDYHASVISLALMHNGIVIMGMIYDPYMDEMFYARKGQGSYCNGRRISVSQAASMEESMIAIGTSPYYKEMAETNFGIFQAVFQDCQDIRRSGSAARDLAYVACGRLDGYFERNLKIWDYAAGMLLVREAGGVVRDYAGQDADTNMVGDILAANNKMASILTEKYLN